MDPLNSLVVPGMQELIIPEGEYYVDGALELPSTLRAIRGSGKQSVIRIIEGRVILSGLESFVVEDIAVYHEQDTQFLSSLRLDDCSDGVIRRCYFRHTNDQAGFGPTWNALSLRRCNAIDVEDCESVGMQFKMSGPGGGSFLTVTRCLFSSPKNFAVSAVVVNEGDRLHHVYIDDVRVLNPIGAGAIFLGSDDGSETVLDMLATNLKCRGVRVSGDCGDDPSVWVGINVRGTPINTENVSISDCNIHRNKGTRPCRGIFLAPRPGAGGAMKTCSILDVSLRGMDRHDVLISGDVRVSISRVGGSHEN
jgi:hypothetical protein